MAEHHGDRAGVAYRGKIGVAQAGGAHPHPDLTRPRRFDGQLLKGWRRVPVMQHEAGAVGGAHGRRSLGLGGPGYAPFGFREQALGASEHSLLLLLRGARHAGLG